MTHRTEGELQAWLDAELPAPAAAEVAGHLMVCTECRARLGELRLAGERLRVALAELDAGSARSARPGRGASRTALRAAAMILAVAGAAAAVVPGSPLRQLLERMASSPPESVPVEVPAVESGPGPGSPGIASVTVSPVDGRVDVLVDRFADGSRITVRFAADREVRALLLSGDDGARFSVGPGRLYVVANAGEAPAEVLIELPRGLNSATVSVDGSREVVASRDGMRRTGVADRDPRDEVVLRVGG
jgi:hypothetical protein